MYFYSGKSDRVFIGNRYLGFCNLPCCAGTPYTCENPTHDLEHYLSIIINKWKQSKTRFVRGLPACFLRKDSLVYRGYLKTCGLNMWTLQIFKTSKTEWIYMYFILWKYQAPFPDKKEGDTDIPQPYLVITWHTDL